MTDQELSALGARLYSALIGAQLSEPALHDLAEAIETQCPWPALGDRTKISIFVVASQLEKADLASDQGAPGQELLEPPPAVDLTDEDAGAEPEELLLESDMPLSGEPQEPLPDADAVTLEALAEEPNENSLEETEPVSTPSTSRSEATSSS